MTLEQYQALCKLRKAIEHATETSLFDWLATYLHPDIINEFCDAVMEVRP